MFTSMIVVLLIGAPFIKFFSARQILDPIREDGPSEHIVKKIGTPTMGGLVILIGIVVSVLLWSDLSNIYMQSVTVVDGGGSCTQLDVNNDGVINIIDVVQTVNLVLGSTAPSEWESCAADGNSDVIINVIDIVILVNYILS